MRRAAVTAALFLLAGGCGRGAGRPAAAPPRPTLPTAITSPAPGNTVTTASAAPQTSLPAPSGGLAAVPATTLIATLTSTTDVTPFWATPGGPQAGTVPTPTTGPPVAVPVVTGGPASTWIQVLLADGARGWLPRTSVDLATTDWFLEVAVGARTLTIYRAGRLVATTLVAVGAPATPTPIPPGGLTFIAGDLHAAGSALEPFIRTLGVHGTPQAEFPKGTVAIHGWHNEVSDPAIFGHGISHGCIRVPATQVLVDAMEQVPNGTLVAIRP